MEKMKKSNQRIEIILLIASLILFALIWINLNSSWISFLDNLINLKMNSIENNTLTFIFEKISYIFEPINCIIFLIVLSIIFWIKKFRKESLFIALTGIIGGGFVYLLKEIIVRIRPENSIIPETGFSFPSGHATIGLILFGCLIYYAVKHLKNNGLKKVIISLSLIFILLIGFSRIYLRVHWFSDVIAGFLLGVFVISLVLVLQKFLSFRIKMNMSQFML